MKNNKVSIVIPYYDCPLYLLRKCINSCLNQTYDNLEILVLIDGSPKDLTHIIKHYEEANDNIKFIISDTNHGVSFQRNLGIEKSSGEYIQFVDADDYIEPEMIQKMVNRMESDGSDVVICGVSETVYECDNGLFDTRTFFSFPSRFCHIQYTNFPTNKLFKLDILKNNQIRFNEKVKLGEDAIFCQEYYKHVSYISCMPERFYHYVRQIMSATKGFDPDYFKYEDKVISAIEDNFSRKQLNDHERQYILHWHYRKVYMVYEHYFNAFSSRIITKKELLDYYKDISEDEVFAVDSSGLRKNLFYLKDEYRSAKALSSRNPARILRAIAKARGKRATIKTIVSK